MKIDEESETLMGLENEPPCKNGLCKKYLKKVNPNGENWVEDLNDSIADAP
jgi:hypothetical protein